MELLGILIWAPKMTSPLERRSQTKYCEIHRDNGHDTEQCIELKREIEYAISQEHLKDFIDHTVDRKQEKWNSGLDHKAKQGTRPAEKP